MRDYETYFANRIKRYFETLLDGVDLDLSYSDDNHRDIVHEEYLVKSIEQAEKDGYISTDTRDGLIDDMISFGHVFDEFIEQQSKNKELDRKLSVEDL